MRECRRSASAERMRTLCWRRRRRERRQVTERRTARRSRKKQQRGFRYRCWCRAGTRRRCVRRLIGMPTGCRGIRMSIGLMWWARRHCIGRTLRHGHRCRRGMRRRRRQRCARWARGDRMERCRWERRASVVGSWRFCSRGRALSSWAWAGRWLNRVQLSAPRSKKSAAISTRCWICRFASCCSPRRAQRRPPS